MRRRAGIGIRVAVAAALLVALSVGLLGTAVVWFVGRTLEHDADSTAMQRAVEIVTTVEQHGADTAATAFASARSETSVAQVVDDTGRVLASSPQLDGEPPLIEPNVTPGQTRHLRSESLPVGDGTPYLLVEIGLRRGGADLIVIVAQSLQTAESSVHTVAVVLAVVLPLVAVIAGAVTFALAGRSLRPVEAIRREVSTITAQQLDRRVPVPQAEDEVSRLAETMNDMLARVEVAHDAQCRFVADAGHELRSPLTTVKARLQLVGNTSTPADWPESHSVLTLEVNRIERIVANLLLLARADASGLMLQTEVIELDDLVEEERLRLRAATGITVSGQVMAVRCVGDRHQLAQVLRNLTDNAVSHARSRIELTLVAEDSQAIIEVADDGPGIPLEDRTRVFARFVRLDPARARSAGGTGLGLAIVTEVVRAHNGTVTAGVGLDGGARFIVRIPIHHTGEHQPPSRANRYPTPRTV
ncbi:MAG: HAMP domain-containing sensor histidine kinase [Nocardioidaceae bacterium]